MTAEHIQIMLVSDQAAANLVAALDEQLAVTDAVLLVTSKMQQRADALASVLRQTGRKVSLISIEDEKDFDQIQNIIIDLADKHTDKDVSVNLTGGTKLMALAVQNTVLLQPERAWKPFYVDIDSDTIVWLQPNKSPQRLTQTLKLTHYLNSYGFSVQKTTPPPLTKQQEYFLDDLIKNVGSFEVSIGQLNGVIQQTHKDATRIDLEKRQVSESLDFLLGKLETANLIRRTDTGFQFTDYDAKRFCSGGWLEAHVYRVIEQLSGELGMRDKALNPEVTAYDGPKNELDVVFLLGNRLHVIECKTARLDQGTKANDALYKLAENCRRVGGIGTRGMLATYRKLNETELRLAQALNIECVAGSGLNRLPEKIKSWVRR
jgi:hypothetical protein